MDVWAYNVNSSWCKSMLVVVAETARNAFTTVYEQANWIRQVLPIYNLQLISEGLDIEGRYWDMHSLAQATHLLYLYLWQTDMEGAEAKGSVWSSLRSWNDLGLMMNSLSDCAPWNEGSTSPECDVCGPPFWPGQSMYTDAQDGQ